MNATRIARPRHEWSRIEDEKLIVAYEQGGMPACYTAFPSLRAKQISGRVSWLRTSGEQKRLQTARRRAEEKRARITLMPNAKKAVVQIPKLDNGEREYLRRRIEHEIERIATELQVGIASVRLAMADWAVDVKRPDLLTIETETNAVDRAYGDAAVTVSFKFGARG